jgi:Tol biopolymer transport system component
VAWSPDGKRIAFGTTPDDSDYANIVLVDPDGGHRRTVVEGDAGANWGGVAWSPDGTTLAVARRSDAGGDPDGVPDLRLVNVRTGRSTELALDTSDPSWSPDGIQIAAATDTGSVVVLDLGKGGSRVVGTGADPSWSQR